MLSECDFWSSIVDSANMRFGIDYTSQVSQFPVEIDQSKRGLLKRSEFLKYYRKRVNLSEELHRRIENNRVIYDEVFEATGASILVDSSKNLTRALLLKKMVEWVLF